MYAFTSSQISIKIPDDMTQLLFQVEAKIKIGSALWYYQLCKTAFILQVFPFANAYKNQLNLPDDLIKNQANFAVDQALIKLNDLKETLKRQKASINNDDDSQKFGSSFTNDGTDPSSFYKWDGAENKMKVRKLLSGESIFLDANIIKGLDYDAIKFNEIYLLLHLQSNKSKLVGDFNKVLQKFQIKLTHSGNAFYRFKGKYYTASSTILDIQYSFKQISNGLPKTTNSVFDKLKNGDIVDGFVGSLINYGEVEK